jgi:hypothetical protein
VCDPREKESIPTMNTAEEVLREPYVSYEIPLAKARQWIKKRERPLLEEAIKLLQALRDRHPYATKILPDLALAMLESNDREGAERLLAQYRPDDMAMGEEMLCRCGRLLRESGDENVCLDGSARDPNRDRALERYDLSLRQYERAYAIRQSYYPGVNVAALRLRIYAVTPAGVRDPHDLSALQDFATRLLERRQQWPRNPEANDDELWRIATTGDCHLLREEWAPAAENYKLVQQDRACQPFHVECMRRTAEGVIHCFRRIGRTDFGPFEDLRNVFGSSQNVELLNALNRAQAWFHARKTRPIWARRLDRDRTVETLEGAAAAEAGDFLCRGEAGELWPQSAQSLEEKYAPSDTVDENGWRRYDPRPDAEGVLAARVDHPFSLQTKWGSLTGNAGDYVVKRFRDKDTAHPADVWIVNQALFRAAYEPVAG